MVGDVVNQTKQQQLMLEILMQMGWRQAGGDIKMQVGSVVPKNQCHG
jgi:hypothetical protein